MLYPVAVEAFHNTFLTDECTIYTPVAEGPGTLDRSTGMVTRAAQSVVYEGPCNIKAAQSRFESNRGELSTVTDEMLLRVRWTQELRPDQHVRLRRYLRDEFDDYVIVRVPPRSQRLCTHAFVRRQTYRVTTG